MSAEEEDEEEEALMSPWGFLEKRDMDFAVGKEQHNDIVLFCFPSTSENLRPFLFALRLLFLPFFLFFLVFRKLRYAGNEDEAEFGWIDLVR